MNIDLFIEKFNNYWSSKPIWCKPWTILLTGLLIILSTYFFAPFVWVKLLVFIIISLWWYLFLILAPSIDHQIKDLE